VRALLALHETHAPVWGHDRFADDGGQLLHDCVGRGTHEEVEVKETTSDAPLYPVLRQNHVHGIAVDQSYAVSLAACTSCTNKIDYCPQGYTNLSNPAS